MGLFNFLKSKNEPKPEYIGGIGMMTYCSQFNEYAYHGKIISASLGYEIDLVLPTNNIQVSDYQKLYFKELNKNLFQIAEKASRMPNSKIDLLKYRVDCVSVPDIQNNNYGCDSEIVISQKEGLGIYGRSVYSLIMDNLNISEIIEV